jgi:phosphomannomutase
MLAALHVLAALQESEVPFSRLVASYERYVSSGEVNSRVEDVPAALVRVRAAFEGRGSFDELDGVTVTGDGDGPMWWFNLRGSNTEPLLRLNVEAADRARMLAVRDEVLALVRKDAG